MGHKQLIIDRIEGEIAVCECGGRILEVPLANIDGPAQEGDALLAVAAGRYRADSAATQERRAQLSARFQALASKANKKKPPNGV